MKAENVIKKDETLFFVWENEDSPVLSNSESLKISIENAGERDFPTFDEVINFLKSTKVKDFLEDNGDGYWAGEEVMDDLIILLIQDPDMNQGELFFELDQC